MYSQPSHLMKVPVVAWISRLYQPEGEGFEYPSDTISPGPVGPQPSLTWEGGFGGREEVPDPYGRSARPLGVSLGRDGEQRSSVWDPDRCGGYRDVGRCAGETEESYVERDLLPVDPLDPPGDGDVRTEEGRRLDDPIDREGIEAAFLHDFLQLAPPEDTDPARAQPIGELVGDPFAGNRCRLRTGRRRSEALRAHSGGARELGRGS